MGVFVEPVKIEHILRISEIREPLSPTSYMPNYDRFKIEVDKSEPGARKKLQGLLPRPKNRLIEEMRFKVEPPPSIIDRMVIDISTAARPLAPKPTAKKLATSSNSTTNGRKRPRRKSKAETDDLQDFIVADDDPLSDPEWDDIETDAPPQKHARNNFNSSC